jgi:purine-binding chemotaxis protein CheW
MSDITQNTWLCFKVKEETFAFSIDHVREILTYEESTKVPLMPLFLKGIFNLRGQVIPLLDLSMRFWGTSAEIHERTGIAVLEIENEGSNHTLGVMVDSFDDVVIIPETDIQHPASLGIGIRKEFLRGVIRKNDSMIMLLDTQKVLSLDELASLVSSMDEINSKEEV